MRRAQRACTENWVKHILLLLTVKDTFTRWLEAFPTRDMTASTVVKILAEQVFSRYGLCARIHSDNGRQFVSELYHKLMSKFGIQVSQTPPYNPQSNPVERAHRDLEASLTALCKNKTSKWPEYLPQALFAQRIAICRSTGFSPFELMFGRNPRCELDIMYPLPTDLHQSPQDSAEEYFYKQQEAFQAARLREDVTIRRQRMAYKGPVKRFQEGQSVWLFVPRPPKNFVKLSIWWTGPWTVTNVLNALTYKIQWHNDPNRNEVVTVDRLRPYFHDVVIKPPNTLSDASSDAFIENCTLPHTPSLGVPFTDQTLYPFEYHEEEDNEQIPPRRGEESENDSDEEPNSPTISDDSDTSSESSTDSDDNSDGDTDDSDNQKDAEPPVPPRPANRFKRIRNRIENVPAHLTPNPNSARSRRLLARSQVS